MTTINVNKATRSSLEMPEEFFVEMNQWKEDNPGITPRPEDICKEEIDGRVVEGVNIRTGRKGYYKRTQAVDKTVNRNVELYNGELEISEEAADMWHASALKQTMPSHEAIDISELPIFHMMGLGGGSSMVQRPKKVLQIDNITSSTEAPSATPVLPSDNQEDGAAAHSDQEDHDDQNQKPQPSLSKAMLFAFPTGKAEAASKAMAKAAAKSQAAAKAKQKNADSEQKKGRGKKRKANESLISEMPDDQAKEQADMNSADSSVLDGYQKKLSTFRETLLVECVDTDAGSIESIKKANKELMSLNQSIKTKIKSLGRRRDTPVLLKDGLDELTQEITRVQTTLSALLGSCFEDNEAVEKLNNHASHGWNFHVAIFKRGFKASFMSHLKYSEWHGMRTTTHSMMIETFGEAQTSDIFEMLLNEVVQKLLRAIPANKVSCICCSRFICLVTSVSLLFVCF